MDNEHGTSFEAHPQESRYVSFVAGFMGCQFSEIDYSSERFLSLANQELGKDDMLTCKDLNSLLSQYNVKTANPQSLGVFESSTEQFSELLDGFRLH
jgi:hypothetical protein